VRENQFFWIKTMQIKPSYPKEVICQQLQNEEQSQLHHKFQTCRIIKKNWKRYFSRKKVWEKERKENQNFRNKSGKRERPQGIRRYIHQYNQLFHQSCPNQSLSSRNRLIKFIFRLARINLFFSGCTFFLDFEKKKKK
jgi:hypothetical protein